MDKPTWIARKLIAPIVTMDVISILVSNGPVNADCGKGFVIGSDVHRNNIKASSKNIAPQIAHRKGIENIIHIVHVLWDVVA